MEEVCRNLDISEATFYNWKKKYGGLGISELRKLLQLEYESAQLNKLFADLILDKQMLQDFSRTGKPKDNAYIESFNGSFRDECLNTNWFLSLGDAKQKIEDWKDEYNTFRPHSCLGDLTPEKFIENQVKTANFSTLQYS